MVDQSASMDERLEALAVVNNWRSSHAFPLNTFQMNLRRRARGVDDEALIAQRMKRLSSIDAKLERYQGMKLSRMQDLGGCRAVLKSVPKIRELVDTYKKARVDHHLESTDDYLETPKPSGYRGFHLIYKYGGKREEYHGLQIEIQIRSRLQHAWATAVETVGTFTEQALKSSQGQSDWLRFFALMGSEMALREKTPTIPYTSDRRKTIRSEIKSLASQLDIIPRLNTYGATVRIVEKQAAAQMSGAKYFLLELNSIDGNLKITGFRSNQLEDGADAYSEAEQRVGNRPGCDAVLVSVEAFSNLRRAYPNYFLDTSSFVKAVEQALR